MKTDFIQGEMIVMHESGHVDRYQRADLETEKVNIKQQIARDQAALDTANSDIQKIQSSIGVN